MFGLLGSAFSSGKSEMATDGCVTFSPRVGLCNPSVGTTMLERPDVLLERPTEYGWFAEIPENFAD